MHIEDFCHAPQNGDRRVFLTPLDASNVSHVDPGAVGEGFLGHPPFLPDSPDVRADDGFPTHRCMGQRRAGTV